MALSFSSWVWRTTPIITWWTYLRLRRIASEIWGIHDGWKYQSFLFQLHRCYWIRTMLLVQNDSAWWLVSIPVESTSGFHKPKERIYRWKLGMQRVIQNATYFIDTRVRTRNSKDIPVTQRCCKAPLPVGNVVITYNPFRYPYKWVTEAITLHVSLVVLFFPPGDSAVQQAALWNLPAICLGCSRHKATRWSKLVGFHAMTVTRYPQKKRRELLFSGMVWLSLSYMTSNWLQ